jgi:hypothetical protein
MEELQGSWLTYPAESNLSDKTIIVTVRTDVEKFKSNPRFKYRIIVAWPYSANADGMPDEPTSEIMGQATELLSNTFRKDPVAILTEISTGDSRREWVFYTLSLNIFSKKLNEALASLPVLPLEFVAEEDPDWESYSEVSEI